MVKHSAYIIATKVLDNPIGMHR